MVKPKTEEEIELLRENAIIVSKTLAEVGKWVAPGVTTAKLNEVAETFIRDNGATVSRRITSSRKAISSVRTSARCTKATMVIPRTPSR